MIFQIRHRCPNCGSVADFAVDQVSEVVPTDPDPSKPKEFIFRPPKPGTKPDQNLIEGCGLSRCPLCGGPLLIVFRAPLAVLRAVLTAQSKSVPNPNARLLIGRDLSLVRTFPEARAPTADPRWPHEIQQPFVDLQVMQEEGRHPSLVISGCRTVLDVATRHLGATENRLVDRIDALAKKSVITEVLRAWAHALRVDGNAAVHGFEGTREAATELVEFIKLFLHVTFELPAAIEQRKQVHVETGAAETAPGQSNDRAGAEPQST